MLAVSLTVEGRVGYLPAARPSGWWHRCQFHLLLLHSRKGSGAPGRVIGELVMYSVHVPQSPPTCRLEGTMHDDPTTHLHRP